MARPIPEVVEELSGLAEDEVYIVDDDFLLDQARLQDFCRLLKERKIKKKYLVYGRADFIAAHPALLAQLWEVGLRAVIIGLESYRDEELDALHKGAQIAHSEMAVQILQALGIEVYGTIVLSPDYDRQDFRRLYQWLKTQKLSFVNLQPLTPLPGKELFCEYSARLVVPRTAFEKWDLAHLVIAPERLSSRQYYWQILLLYYRIVIDPGNVWRLLKKYGWRPVLRLSWGSNRVVWQYLKKILRGG